MPIPAGFDPDAAVSAQPLIVWRGPMWRAHNRKYRATDPGGSIRVSGRYNRGLDKFPQEETWSALYLGATYGVCIAEIVRHIEPQGLPSLNQRRLTELLVSLSVVLDCRDVAALGLQPEELLHDTDYEVAQELAAAAIRRNCEAILVPSATQLPDPVLVIFPEYLRSDSTVEEIRFVEPSLYVERSD